MLALAIISTVILGILIIITFGKTVKDYDDSFLFFTILTSLGFVIMTIWLLYTR